MTDTTQWQGAKSTGKPTTPTHVAYHVRDTGNGKSLWTRIGTVWSHKDGKGFSIQVDVVPLDGRITLRTAGENNGQ